MTSPPTAPSSAAGRFRDTHWLLVVGFVCAGLYAAVYWSQRAIYLNGLYASIGGALLFGAPRDEQQLLLAVGVYAASTLALFVMYGLLLRRCEKHLVTSVRARQLAILVPVLFNIAFLLGRPLFSIDIYSYIAHGYLATQPDSNPYQIPVSAVIESQFGRDLVPFGWRPVHGVSPYGPLWTQIETLAFSITQDIRTVLLLLKVVIVAASMASAAIIWKILGHVRPRDQLLGTVAYLWNPLIIVEFAAEGHNDALMIVFVLLGLYLAVRLWRSLSIAALLLGVLSKFIPLILLPAQIVFLWRKRKNWPHFVLHTLVGVALGIGIAALLYQPVWVGMETFRGVQEQGRPSFYASTLVPLMVFLQRTRPEPEAARLSFTIMSGIFVLFAFVRSIFVRDEDSFLRACASIALAYLLLVSPTYWSWYAALPLALMALTPHGTYRWMLIVLALCGRATAPIDDIAVNGFLESFMGYRHPSGAWGIEVWSTTIIALLIPLAFVLTLSVWQFVAHIQRRRGGANANEPTI